MNNIVAIISAIVAGVIGILVTMLKIKSNKISKLEEEKDTLEQEKAKAEKVNDSSKNYIKKLLEVGEDEKISSDSDIDSVLASARDYYNKLQDKRKQ
mgnify:FL=1